MYILFSNRVESIIVAGKRVGQVVSSMSCKGFHLKSGYTVFDPNDCIWKHTAIVDGKFFRWNSTKGWDSLEKQLYIILDNFYPGFSWYLFLDSDKYTPNMIPISAPTLSSSGYF